MTERFEVEASELYVYRDPAKCERYFPARPPRSIVKRGYLEGLALGVFVMRTEGVCWSE